MGDLPLSATSALVLLWGRQCYAGGLAGQYMGKADLSAGQGLLYECERCWPHYSEIIMNRKEAVFEAALGFLDGASQAVILAAGLDPLGLRLIEARKNARIFEVDSEGMGAKSEIYSEILGPQDAGRISLASADISSGRLLGELENIGWRRGEPTIVILEGISYYVKGEELWGIISSFRSKGAAGMAVFDYMIPYGMMDAENARRMSCVFDTISQAVGLPFVSTYDYSSICGEARRRGLGEPSRLTLEQMEQKRTGAGRHFGGARGGIEVCSVPI